MNGFMAVTMPAICRSLSRSIASITGAMRILCLRRDSVTSCNIANLSNYESLTKWKQAKSGETVPW